jgi:hypothetical protein
VRLHWWKVLFFSRKTSGSRKKLRFSAQAGTFLKSFFKDFGKEVFVFGESKRKKAAFRESC